MDKLISDQAEGLRRLLTRTGARVIAVTGGPVGVGCTTGVVNLAAALAQQGKDVLVVDECVGERSVSAMLGGLRGAGNFSAVMRGEMTLDDAAARHPLGFSVLAASRANREGHSPQQFNLLLGGTADIVLIDAQLDLFEREHAELIQQCERAEAAYDDAPREEHEEAENDVPAGEDSAGAKEDGSNVVSVDFTRKK